MITLCLNAEAERNHAAKTFILRSFFFVLFINSILSFKKAAGLDIGAYYYPWYANNFHGGKYLRQDLVPRQCPVLGEYNDRQSSVLSQHMAWSKQANITLWAASWWGQGGTDDVTLKNYILPHSDLGDLKIAIHYETVGRTSNYVYFDYTYSDIQYLAKTYFGHSNYYRIDDRPVIFLYQAGVMFIFGLLENFVSQMRAAAESQGYNLYIIGDGAWGAPNADIIEGISYIDALTNYDVYGSMGATGYAGQKAVNQYYANQKHWRQYAKSLGKGFVPSAMPGFNDKGVRDENVPLSRKLTANSEFGSLFQAMLKQAIQLVDSSSNDLLMITSFNEWHEDTQIEPVSTADATSVDISSTGKAYTDGLEYEGYGEKYLEILQRITEPSYSSQSSAKFRLISILSLLSVAFSSFFVIWKYRASTRKRGNIDSSNLIMCKGESS
eukprot:CAMPEP_0172434722 /NCGR_PEP_ID=MMETSP1064-20121228/70785_1 /TAXON_ID=202472 /ORGANISM="Aulacoseira subarctica , Strain CCAP 1002/5" /LENGTH=438 /DNA_ID=CAMNT_0013182961 /DNA_START=148 /DNA_END=1464 /DNA_ORIENTATION=-